MKNIYTLLYTLIVFVLIQACDTNKPVDREAVKEEMESREIKRVSESEISAKAIEIGNAIAMEAGKTLKTNLLTAIKTEGVPEAIEFCNANALELVQKLEDSMNVTIFRVSQKWRNPKDEPDSLEALMLEAYQYNIDNNLAVEPGIQEENKEVLLYTSPIKIDNPLCLQCHGKIGDEVLNETHAKITSLYPNDNATGYELGQLRGMWSIRIPKKEVVKRL
jgi:hypothetical protein